MILQCFNSCVRYCSCISQFLMQEQLHVSKMSKHCSDQERLEQRWYPSRAYHQCHCDPCLITRLCTSRTWMNWVCWWPLKLRKGFLSVIHFFTLPGQHFFSCENLYNHETPIPYNSVMLTFANPVTWPLSQNVPNTLFKNFVTTVLWENISSSVSSSSCSPRSLFSYACDPR